MEDTYKKSEENTVVPEAENSLNDKEDFQRYVDDYVAGNTNYKSARELLESKIPNKAAYIIIGISVLVALPALPIIILTLPVGIFLACMVTGYNSWQFERKHKCTFCGGIDQEDLIAFLNEYLSCYSPYFSNWRVYEKKKSPGVYYGHSFAGAAAKAAYFSTVDKIAENAKKRLEQIELCADFEGFITQLWISKLTEEEGERVCLFCCVNKLGMSKDVRLYSTRIKAAPILHGAIDYYVKYKKQP